MFEFLGNKHYDAATAAVRAKAERLELEIRQLSKYILFCKIIVNLIQILDDCSIRQLKTDLQQAREVAAAAIAAAEAQAAVNPAAAAGTAGNKMYLLTYRRH